MKTLSRFVSCVLCAALCLLAAACGSAGSVKGKLTHGGQPVTVDKTKGKIAVTFHLLDQKGAATSSFPANVNPDDGTFTVAGRDGGGIPPGKYRVSVEVFEKYPSPIDKFKKQYSGEKSNLIREITRGSQEIDLDLGK